MTSGDSAADVPQVASVFPLVSAWRLDRPFDYLIPAELVGRVRVGSLVRVPLGGRNVRGIVGAVAAGEPDRDLGSILSLVVEEAIVAPPLDHLFEWIATRYAAPRGTVLKRAVPPRVRVAADRPVALSGGPEPSLALRYEGSRSLLAALESGGTGTWMWRTVPGEDHGHIAAELVAAAGRGGGSALVGVPEVAYGSFVLDHLARTWPQAVRVDSVTPEPDRARGLLRLARGHGLGAGGRGVVLAPAPSLRLILLDEEHHASYKEDRTPRFDARRVAVERARLQGAVCVLLSATPSIETGAAAAEGTFGSVAPRRVENRSARPIVEVFDRPRDRALHHELHVRVSNALNQGRRVALLTSKRGYSYLWCAECRRSLRCPRCEAGMFVFRSAAARCPRCGLEEEVPRRCPACGAEEWRFVGAGSERLEEQLRAAWPRAKVVRVDPGSIGTEDTDAVREADIYITTWIGTKPEFRPPVSLVGVLDADALIRVPDFRAAENAYQALAAMAEWAGPADAGGRLVVQTSAGSHHALQAVIRADYDFWLRRELQQRAELRYPPYSELIKATASGPARDEILSDVGRVCRVHGASLLGPISVSAATGSGDALQVLVKCTDAGTVAAELRDILPDVPRGSRLSIDVDPR